MKKNSYQCNKHRQENGLICLSEARIQCTLERFKVQYLAICARITSKKKVDDNVDDVENQYDVRRTDLKRSMPFSSAFDP